MQTIEHYTPKELATALKIPYRLILRAMRSGALKATYFGPKHRLIHSKAAAQWIDSITK